MDHHLSLSLEREKTILIKIALFYLWSSLIFFLKLALRWIINYKKLLWILSKILTQSHSM